MNDEKLVLRGNNVNRFLDSEEWKEAFDSYRARLLSEIENTEDVKHISHCKALLKAAAEAKRHLERIVNEGKLAASQIEIERRRGLLHKLRLI